MRLVGGTLLLVVGSGLAGVVWPGLFVWWAWAAYLVGSWAMLGRAYDLGKSVLVAWESRKYGAGSASLDGVRPGGLANDWPGVVLGVRGYSDADSRRRLYAGSGGRTFRSTTAMVAAQMAPVDMLLDSSDDELVRLFDCRICRRFYNHFGRLPVTGCVHG